MSKQGAVAEKNDGFNAAADAEGVEGRTLYPFLPILKSQGNWITGEVLNYRESKFTPKKGKNKGKPQVGNYFDVRIIKTNMEGITDGDMATISASGLLKFQLTKGLPAGVTLPCVVGIKYLGKDDEGRHQTEVRYPSSR